MNSQFGNCPANNCPNMNIWLPVLMVPMILGMLGVLLLRKWNIPIDAITKAQSERS